MAVTAHNRLSDGDISDITESTPEELQEWTLTDRFSTVVVLKTEVLDIHKQSANSASYYVDEEASDIKIRVKALLALSRSVRHTPAYLELLNKSRKKTVQLIARDTHLVEDLRRWAANDNSWNNNLRKESIRKVYQHQVAGTNTAIGDFSRIHIEETTIDYYNEPSRWHEIFGRGKIRRINKGEAYGKLGLFNLRKENRKIKVNENSETGWNNSPARVCGIVHHETVHDQGFQLAQHCRNGEPTEKLDSLSNDALLWYELKMAKATIPARIYSAYREQFHEVVAFEQQDLFKQELAHLLETGEVIVAHPSPAPTAA